jgi:Arc/MetJ-type ribon-helix-helix transcriptional regulator
MKHREMSQSLNTTTVAVTEELRDKLKEYKQSGEFRNMNSVVNHLYQKEVNE